MKKTLTSLILVLVSVLLFSQTKKIKDLENQRKAALREIENTTQLLNTTKKTTETLLSRISLLSEQMKSRTQVIALLNQEIQVITEEEAKIESEIVLLQSDLKVEQDAYAKAVQGIAYRKANKSKLLFILSGKSLAESLRRMKYLRDYSLWRKNQADKILEKQTDLRDKRQMLAETKASKLALLGSRQQEQLKLEEEGALHKKEVEEAASKQKDLQAIIDKRQKQAENLNVQIQAMIEAEIQRQERAARQLAQEQEKRRKIKEQEEAAAAEERARREKANSNNEKLTKKNEENSQNKESERNKQNQTVASNTSNTSREQTYITKDDVKLSSSFAANKGRLPIPVTGSYTIVGKFGVHRHEKWKVSTNSNGIDIQAKSGAQARAVFGGEVSKVVAFPGFNNCIIIRHGEYYTFYGNIKNVSVRQGQKVSTGQSLGSIFTDPDTNTSLLHFQLWKGTSKLNPEPWLR